ncbi:MAG: type II toxin-antitoxin system HicB family antitoxin [bacterium]|nr:type II toxin-antitoxin system HicB family antitoxin [bacterium]
MRRLHLHSLIEKEDNLYSAICLELNVASQGETIDEAKKNLQEAVELYLEDVIEAGDEQEFIPRPASEEAWIKFFDAETKLMIKKLSNIALPNSIKFEEIVYAR